MSSKRKIGKMDQRIQKGENESYFLERYRARWRYALASPGKLKIAKMPHMMRERKKERVYGDGCGAVRGEGVCRAQKIKVTKEGQTEQRGEVNEE